MGKTEKVIITEAAILRSRKRDSDDVIDQDMIGASKRNISEDLLSMVDGARFFA